MPGLDTGPGANWAVVAPPSLPRRRCLHHRKETEMMLNNKVAVIYGAGGAIGAAVARAFAREGARLFLTGRLLAPVEALAKEIISAGGAAGAVVDKAGHVDVSFNAIGIPDAEIVGVPLVELDLERFSRPITAHTISYFLTARLAARRMVARKS